MVASNAPRQFWLVSLVRKSLSQLTAPPTRHLVVPLISEIAGGLVFCLCSRDRQSLSISLLSVELRRWLSLLEAGRFREIDEFSSLPEELMELKGVFLAGKCEFTECPNFSEIIRELIRIREMSRFPDFKMVLTTNGKQLDAAHVRAGLKLFLPSDEIWLCLKASDPETNEALLEKILGIATQRPVVIQSAFYAFHQDAHSQPELNDFIGHLKQLKDGGAQVSLVQVCSPPLSPNQRATLKLKSLAFIARQIREETGFTTEFY